MLSLPHGATNETTSQGWTVPVAWEDPRREKIQDEGVNESHGNSTRHCHQVLLLM
jgi:hypothetical protein